MLKAASLDLTSVWQSGWSVLSSPRSLRLLCKLQGHCDVHNRFRSWRSLLDTIVHLSHKPKDLLHLPMEHKKDIYREYVAKDQSLVRPCHGKSFFEPSFCCSLSEMHKWMCLDSLRCHVCPFSRASLLPMRDSFKQIELGKEDISHMCSDAPLEFRIVE